MRQETCALPELSDRETLFGGWPTKPRKSRLYDTCTVAAAGIEALLKSICLRRYKN